MSSSKKTPARTKPHGSATAASILGQQPTVKAKRNGDIKVKGEWVKFYQRLLELRDQLIRQMNGLAKESAQEMAGFSLHMVEFGTDKFNCEFGVNLYLSQQVFIF